jgi:hypothetical protein
MGKSLTMVWWVMAALVACLFDCQPALAQREPVIVVPGRAGYQVMMWGQDVSGAVIEGEFGLDRPSHVGVNVIPVRPLYLRYAINPTAPAAYYPATGNKPAYGRLEVVPSPHRQLPPPAATYLRSWSSESPHLPASADPPLYPPPIIVAPQIDPPRPTRRSP